MSSHFQKCGHLGLNWDGNGNCITCARDKALDITPQGINNTPDKGAATQLSQSHSPAAQELRKAITEYGKRSATYPGVGGEVKLCPTDEEVDAIMQLIEAEASRREREAKTTGHWYAGTYGRDANGFEIGHQCNCGYRNTNKQAVEQHAAWNLAELKSRGEQG